PDTLRSRLSTVRRSSVIGGLSPISSSRLATAPMLRQRGCKEDARFPGTRGPCHRSTAALRCAPRSTDPRHGEPGMAEPQAPEPGNKREYARAWLSRPLAALF